jgi:hypothetical protein
MKKTGKNIWRRINSDLPKQVLIYQPIGSNLTEVWNRFLLPNP